MHPSDVPMVPSEGPAPVEKESNGEAIFFQSLWLSKVAKSI